MQRLCRKEVTGGSIHRKKLRRAYPHAANKRKQELSTGQRERGETCGTAAGRQKTVLIKETHR